MGVDLKPVHVNHAVCKAHDAEVRLKLMVPYDIYYAAHVRVHVPVRTVTGGNPHPLQPSVNGVIKHAVVHVLIYLSRKNIQRNTVVRNVFRHNTISLPEQLLKPPSVPVYALRIARHQRYVPERRGVFVAMAGQ